MFWMIGSGGIHFEASSVHMQSEDHEGGPMSWQGPPVPVTFEMAIKLSKSQNFAPC